MYFYVLCVLWFGRMGGGGGKSCGGLCFVCVGRGECSFDLRKVVLKGGWSL